MSSRSIGKPSICPVCDSKEIFDIVYGTIDADAAKHMNNVVFGGCVVTGDDPKWQCSNCGTDFYRVTKH